MTVPYKLYHYIGLIVALLLHPAITAFGNSGGSGYSRYGLGDIRYFSTSRAMGMGGASIAVLSTHSIDRNNPASWTKIANTRFSASALYEGYSTTDGINSTFLSGMIFNGIMFAIPVDNEKGITVVGGFTPLSRINYNIISPVSLGQYEYTLRYRGDGGLSQAQLGISASPHQNIHVGTKIIYYLGTVQHNVEQKFSSSQYTTSEVSRTTHLQGVGFTIGTIYTGLRNLFDLPSTNMLNVGAVFTSTSYLNTTNDRLFDYTVGTTVIRDTAISPDGTLRLPFAIGVGLSFLSDRILLAGDLYYQNWSRYTVNGLEDLNIRNSYRASAGGELLPKRDASSSLFQRIAYRLGLFYHATYYNIRNEPINELGLTGGIGLPLFSDTRLNIGVEYAFRGTTNQQLQKDKILRISFTLSGAELWFVRPQEE